MKKQNEMSNGRDCWKWAVPFVMTVQKKNFALIFLLAAAIRPVFFLTYISFGRSKQINLIEMLPVAQIHQGLL